MKVYESSILLVYRWLDGSCDKVFENPKSTAAVAVKTAADQLIWAPVMTCAFFAFLKLLEGHPELMLPTIQDKVIQTVAANYVIWPAAHIISFKYVPSHQRILYNNVVAIFWNCYLSIVAADSGVTDVMGTMDVVASGDFAGLRDMADRVQSTLPFGGFWLSDVVRYNDMIQATAQSALQLAGNQSASMPFFDSVVNLQSSLMKR
jgi:hypothetical protein